MQPVTCSLRNARALSTAASSQLLNHVGHITRGLSRIVGDDTMIIRGKGSYVEMHDGKQLLDFTTGIGVTALGHCHPTVTAAAANQCEQLVHAQCSISTHPSYLSLIQKLKPHLPSSSLDSFFWWNSGSEAVEAAIKMSRIVTGKQNIICMQGAYHGRTYGAMSVTKSKTIYSIGASPLMPGTYVSPFPYWHHFPKPLSSPTTSAEDLSTASLEALELLLKQQTAPSDTAAIIVEPVLGEGGYVPAPTEFLRGLKEIAKRNDILLIIDEVQSGFCRTGAFWAIEESGVVPDILLTAKGLANGFPLSGVITRKEISNNLKPGSMGGTYAGNAVSCAAACAVIDAIQEENVLDNVNARSKQLFTFLDSLKSDPELNKYILDVRGKGLMVGVEFTGSYPGLASKIAKACLSKGLLILTTSVYETIRFIPPLNVSEEQMKAGCKIFGEALREVTAEL